MPTPQAPVWRLHSSASNRRRTGPLDAFGRGGQLAGCRSGAGGAQFRER
jgi:hypothetical protein